MNRFFSIFAFVSMLAACGWEGDGTPSSPGANGEAPIECLPVDEGSVLELLKEPHSARVEPEEMLEMEERTGTSIRMLGTMTEHEARLQLHFERCLDLSRLRDIVFKIQGINGRVEVGLDAPTNSPPPWGTCVGLRCLAPRFEAFAESDGPTESASWDDFQNGSPGAVADPYHVIGLTWTRHGEPGDRVDLTISNLVATTLY
jgi:hypothetical protein